ncbi:MAG: M15 family metallopeptidase [Candidatus Sericytochromatia bacterium]|nr:M15 family metallopeptidase [Candidatus Sericytochromatia bacterium]
MITAVRSTQPLFRSSPALVPALTRPESHADETAFTGDLVLTASLSGGVGIPAAPVTRHAPVKARRPIPTIGSGVTIKRYGHGFHVMGQLAPGLVRDLGASPEANQALLRMQADAAAAGISLIEVYGYRSIAEQRVLFRQSDRSGRWVARPGKSEHHTGVTYDINTTSSPFSGSIAYRWMKQHACEYGFLQSMSWESWHWRYDPVAVKAAVKRIQGPKKR